MKMRNGDCGMRNDEERELKAVSCELRAERWK